MSESKNGNIDNLFRELRVVVRILAKTNQSFVAVCVCPSVRDRFRLLLFATSWDSERKPESYVTTTQAPHAFFVFFFLFYSSAGPV